MKLAKALLTGTALLASPAMAEELAVVGSWSNLPLYQDFESPF